MYEEKQRYFVLNKPQGIVSQFVSPHNVGLLGDLKFDFPEGTHALGRLDNDSEGLLILTTNKKMTRLLFGSSQKHKRSYLVLVKDVVSQSTLEKLRTGVTFQIAGNEAYTSSPCEVEIVSKPLEICDFAHDEREKYPHTWLLITLTEGKFHQVRKMVGTVHHRCLRLIRISIESLSLDGLQPGKVREMKEEEIFARLFHDGLDVSK